MKIVEGMVILCLGLGWAGSARAEDELMPLEPAPTAAESPKPEPAVPPAPPTGTEIVPEAAATPPTTTPQITPGEPGATAPAQVDSPAPAQVDSPATVPVDSPATVPVDSPATVPVDSPATAPVDPAATAPVDPLGTAPVDPAATLSGDPASAAPAATPPLGEPPSTSPFVMAGLSLPFGAVPKPVSAEFQPAVLEGDEDPGLTRVSNASFQAGIPPEVARTYNLSLSDDKKVLTIDPSRPGGTRSLSMTTTAAGGRHVEADSGAFVQQSWGKNSFHDLPLTEANRRALVAEKYALDQPRDILHTVTEKGERISFALSKNGDGFVAICKDGITFANFSDRGRIVVRKPVIYLYPREVTEITVSLDVPGRMLAEYPLRQGDGWRVLAAPDGTLTDRSTGKRYPYLFWEADHTGFRLEPSKAHCVAGHEARAFLEGACERYALNFRESTDFLTYWLPALERNKYSLVQFLDEEVYGRYARMTVTPRPETLLRMFMIFRRLEAPVAAGNPDIEQRTRSGYTVVEWGGSDLDELTDSPPVRASIDPGVDPGRDP